MSNVDTPAAYFYCFGVPPVNDRPRVLTIAVGIGAVEAIALTLYGVSIAIFEQTSETSGISGSGAVLLVTWMLAGGRRAARTPFVMVQAFAIVVGQPLAAAAPTRIAGIVVMTAALLAIGVQFSSSAKEYLR
jgi:hypothetical protein